MEPSAFDRLAMRIPLYGEALLRLPDKCKAAVFDVHLKSGQPVSLCGRDGVLFLRRDGGLSRALTEDLLSVSFEDLQEVFLQTCGYSVYSHEEELSRGYIRLEGGGRVGVCGTAVLEGGAVRGVRDVTSLIFRVPRDRPGCADPVFLSDVELARGLLIVGEPSSGKTTLLRDLARSISMGRFFPAARVAVLDKRGEIAGGGDLGPCADVLTGWPTAPGLDLALRMLAPEYLVCDELSPRDLPAVRESLFSGVPLIASVHGDRESLSLRPLCRALTDTGAFGTALFLTGRGRPGQIAELRRLKGGGWDEDAGGCADPAQRDAGGPVQGG